MPEYATHGRGLALFERRLRRRNRVLGGGRENERVSRLALPMVTHWPSTITVLACRKAARYSWIFAPAARTRPKCAWLASRTTRSRFVLTTPAVMIDTSTPRFAARTKASVIRPSGTK